MLPLSCHSILTRCAEYWIGLWQGLDFGNRKTPDCLSVIHKDIIGVWNLIEEQPVMHTLAYESKLKLTLGTSAVP